MSIPIISASGLSKVYTLGQSKHGEDTFRETVVRALSSPFRRLKELSGVPASADKSFWAVQNISFDIKQGEIVGLIGRNGAGKSTLLKILSRITEPTDGRAVLRGRVGALLEVGTGFHPELTGRENIFLNGAILGMSRSEITRRFDEIVAFSQVEKFLDTPVKRYSSGMYVRLAFAVAAHLEPEILIIDEVLAVGDAEFQRKCLGRMDELRSKGGRTIIVVSHNLEMIEALCSRCILLDQGKIVFDGNTREALDRYRSLGGSGGEVTVTASPKIQWQGLQNRHELNSIRGDQDLVFQLAFQVGAMNLENVQVDLELVDSEGRRATHSKSRFLGSGFNVEAHRNVIFKYSLKAPMLSPGKYFLIVYVYDHSGAISWVEHVDACLISSHSYFPGVDFIDEIKGVAVPIFNVELMDGK